ncbi:MAG: peptidylprolyl isomerase [Alphaproteobacteria bacterium]|nr:peptidylprolyl isomerase [Alphaproteobacteria bacterium]
MIIKHMLGMAAVGLSLTIPTFGFENTAKVKKINEFDVRLMEAADARDYQNPVFSEALESGRWQALVYLGQIGGDACAEIAPYLSHSDAAAVAAARLGAALCHGDAPVDELLAYTQPLPASAGVDYLASALGFSGEEGARPLLVDYVNAIKPGKPFNVGYPDNPRTLPFFGLMQSVVYDRLPATDFPKLSFEALLAHTSEMGTDYVAAYLLTRFTDMPEVLPFADVQTALGNAQASRVKAALVRVLRQYGDAASGTLVALASGKDRMVALEAVRALGYLKDDESRVFLLEVAAKAEDMAMRHLALSALAPRHAGDAEITGLLEGATKDQNAWIAVTALRGLMQRDPDKAFPTTESWFKGKDYYKAFSAMGLLAQSEEGKGILEAYAEAHADSIRGREAAIALDPSIEGVEKPRVTPRWSMVRSYQERELVLNTTRGTICIAPSPDAPYAAANFMLLADVGKMNGMLWHRVIPNFVAQAGQSEDPVLAEWGTIREEWVSSNHRIGTVGVATAGRDTGSTQFFINTGYNLHLNGRYTVMGRVISGLEAAMQLQEGDVIESAKTVRAGTCAL